MNRSVLSMIILNVVIISAVFISFIFFDTNHIEAEVEIVAPTLALDETFEDYSPFDWDGSYYEDKNYLNTNTNKVWLSTTNGNLYLAFYSYREAYYRFEVAEFHLKTDIDTNRIHIAVVQDGEFVEPYLSDPALILRKGEDDNEWVGYWLNDWKTPTGTYYAYLYVDGIPVYYTSFDYIKRNPMKFNRTLTVVNLESNQPTYSKDVYNSRLEETNFTDALIDWMDYADIDAFVSLSGETTGWYSCTTNQPWEYYCVKNLEEIGKKVHDVGKLVGAYIMCFYTPELGWKNAGYSAAKGVNVDSPSYPYTYNSYFVSFKDEKRFNDIVELAKYFNDLDYVDMIGFDFIRFGEKVGFENADRFVREMNVDTPSGWDDYTEKDKTLWLGKQVRYYGDDDISDKWKLWKAHMSAEFIYRVRTTAGLTKPTWAFTLSWDHGTGHGQDPFMMIDAGLLMDFPMLYEATSEMFSSITEQWDEFLDDEYLTYAPGNQIDAVIMDSMHGYNVIEEYYDRLTKAITFNDNYASQGSFVHDMYRVFWGRRGGYTYYEWLWAGLSGHTYNRSANHEIPFTITFPQTEFKVKYGENAVVPISIDIDPSSIYELKGKQIVLESVGHNLIKKVDISENTNIILEVYMDASQLGDNFLGLKAEIEDYPPYFTFKYLNFRRSY